MTSMRELSETISDQQAELARLREEVSAWRRAFDKGAKRDIAFTNSGSEVEPLYSPLDADAGATDRLGVPGVFPYTTLFRSRRRPLPSRMTCSGAVRTFSRGRNHDLDARAFGDQIGRAHV